MSSKPVVAESAREEIMEIIMDQMRTRYELEQVTTRYVAPLKDKIKACDRRVRALLIEAANGQGRLPLAGASHSQD